jgi:hypothetical protein
MTNQEKTDLILESMRAEVATFVESQGQIASATEYEDQLLIIARKFAGQLALHSSDAKRKGRNAKKKS